MYRPISVGLPFEEEESDFNVPICKSYELIRTSAEDFDIKAKPNPSSHLHTELEKIDETDIDNEDDKERLHIDNDQKNPVCYCVII